jgi:MFS family permease
VGGAAGSVGVLVAARGTQGLFAALLAPSALALLATTFSEPDERGKAFGIFGAVAGGGSAVGLLLGGILTEWLGWRWCLYVNLLIAVPTAIAGLRLLENVAQPARPRLDLAGTVLATGGLFALVYGFSNTESHSWGDPVTIVALALAVVLLIAFAFVESRVAHPLLPLRVITNRVRGGSFLALGISGIALFAVFLFLTYYLQLTKGFSPIKTGLAYLPMTAAIIASATLATNVLLAKVGPRPLLVAGMALGALAMVWFAQLDTTSSYAGHVLPGLIVLGSGWGTSSRRDSPARPTVSHPPTPASHPPWSTRCSRSAVRSAQRF